MALEVFARPVVGVASWAQRRTERDQDACTDVPVDEPIELKMRAATYANTSYSGVDVDLYS
jgi:hypothetical protein